MTIIKLDEVALRQGPTFRPCQVFVVPPDDSGNTGIKLYLIV